MKCSIEKVHSLLNETDTGREEATVQLYECFEDEITQISRMLPEKSRGDGKQRACMQLVLEWTKKIHADGFQKRKFKRCKE
ncbi:hypothetical protein ACOJUR_08755 [Alicyclobacillus tolerans]|uniref:hypothetical protein n=1 Tax=Alicyclobacillus tolerans TaxID=90970 RepID=UPI003B7BC14D